MYTMNKQYTIRSIPEPVDRALKLRAQKTGKSFNYTVVEALERATNTKSVKNTYTDLDKFIGIGIADQESFDKSMEWLNSLPNDLDSDLAL